MKDTLSLDELRAGILERLSKITSREILFQIHALLNTSERDHDWWDDLTDTQKSSIEKGLADLKAGRRKSHEEVMKKYGM